MNMRSRRLAGLLGAAVFIAACGPGATASPTAGPSTPPASTGPTEVPSVAPTPVAVVPDGQLLFPGKLVICSDLPYPPFEFFDEQGNPTGSDIDLGTEIGARLGLTVEIENSVFDTIIAAVTGGKCDIVISDQNITEERLGQVDMIPYFKAGQSFVVAKGNPAGINTVDDLCGKAIAAETGTTEVQYLNGTGDYKGKGLSEACTKKGLGAIDAKEYTKDTEALSALLGAQVDAYFADSPVAGYYVVQHADQFELSAIPPLEPIKVGISVPRDPTTKGHTGVYDAVKAALLSMVADGTYTTILSKYGLESGGLTAADIQ
jgi:polar amino acid transport system substrate-binding protein